MHAIDAGEGFYEGLAVDLPEAEPTVADLAAIEAGLDVQDRLEVRDLELARQVRTGPVDELAVRRDRRNRRQRLLEVAA